MLWIVVLTLATLAAIAYGWVSVRTSQERITISLELVKIMPAFRHAREFAGNLVHREPGIKDQRSQH